jgi:hypothetical protein
MAWAPARPKQIKLRPPHRILGRPRRIEDDLNPELPHANESVPTRLRRRPLTTTGTRNSQHVDLWTDHGTLQKPRLRIASSLPLIAAVGHSFLPRPAKRGGPSRRER